MKGALCRGEFLEVVLRLALTTCPKGEPLSNHLPGFIQEQLVSTLPESEILNVRKAIRGNDKIHQLLWDNKPGISKIFGHFKVKKHATLEGVSQLFTLLGEEDSKKKHIPFIHPPHLARLFRSS